MKKHLIIMLIVGILGMPPPAAFADTTYHIADYYPIHSGNIWFFSRNIFMIGPQDHAFENYSGSPWYDVRTITDMFGYIHVGVDGLLFVGLGQYRQGALVDLENTPIKIASADCQIGDSFQTVIEAGVIDEEDEDGLTILSTFAAVEDVIITDVIPNVIFQNCLKFTIHIIDSDTSWYDETLWLAEGIGPVRIYRPDEDPDHHEGCFMTCGAFDDDENGPVVERDMLLEAFVSTNGGDVNGDGKIGLEDAVKALQTVSGVR